jgi:quinol monooxygenase YgiN
MVTVTAEFTVNPGKDAEAEAAIRSLVEDVQANEPGALLYAWHRHRKDPSRLLVFEVYADDAAIEAHRSTPHLAAFQKHFAPGATFDPTSVKIERWERFAAAEH